MKMKKIFYIIIGCLLFLSNRLWAQNNMTDTTITFKVFGACEQCKDRIEKAAAIKGVKNVDWDVDTKLLTLVYNAKQVSPDKVKNRIVAVGHDIDNKKASQSVYNALPSCCHYRELPNMTEHHSDSSHTNQISQVMQLTQRAGNENLLNGNPQNILGIVLEADNKGQFNPLLQASVSWLGAKEGVLTDSTGVFKIPFSENANRLVISYTGYRSDTLTITDRNVLKVILASNNQLKGVTVTGRQRASYVSTISTIRSETMTSKELLKAACCNLSESFETNPSVDVSYNDAVTGSKQIQLLGLSGNYTQLTVENLPGPRGIATPLGLNSIAGPWIESIQLTKGVGSVANGFESIAGQINVELKKPENSEQLLGNIYVNDFGKTDLNLNLSTHINKKWSAGLLLHDDFLNNKHIDFNKDGFRDLPTGNQMSLVNRYKFDNSNGLLAQFGFKIVNDKKTGGETLFDPAKDKATTNHYGLGIQTERYEGFAKIGYVFPQKKYKSIGWQLAAISHRQDAYFGLTTYAAKQESFYSNLIYQSIIGNTDHKFRTGLSFQYDQYQENYSSKPYNRTETVPGAFFEYTYTMNDQFSAVAGIRADHNNLFGFFVTPRLNLRYEPVKGTVIRASAGRGQRTANIFAENSSVFVSARQVNIINPAAGKAYGLNPEIAWNKGISVDQKFRLFDNDAMLSLDYFRNDFTNQVIVDVENPREIRFYNLTGRSFSNSFQTELTMVPLLQFDLRLAYRFFDVQSTYSGNQLQRPFIASHRAFLSLDYATNNWKFNYTLTYNGKKRIPATQTNPAQYRRETESPAYATMNAQISKSLGNKSPMDFYIGVENLTNFFQKDVIIAADQPFGNYFDASMVWGPVSGRMFYAGWRIKIK
jgi:outer membrane receptor for ferrienterochelin and colicin/copper chaperone CopZ